MKKFLSILLSVALMLSCMSTAVFAAVNVDMAYPDATMTDATSTDAIKLGDVNNDGKVSVVDAKWVLQNVAETRELDDDQAFVADVTQDGKISVLDAKWILQAVAGLRELPEIAPKTEDYVDPDGEEMAALAEAIETAQAADTEGYTPESVEALNDAIDAAQALQGRDDVTADEIAQAIEDLEVAQKALETDKSELEDAIEAAYSKNTTGYDPAAVDAYYETVEDIKSVLNDKNATPADVAEALDTLQQAEAGLVADKTALENALADAEAVDTEGMTPDSVAAFEEALANAQAVMDDPTSTPGEVAAAAQALVDAQNALVVDKEALNDKITEADALDLTGYTAESVTAVNDALDDAKTVNNDANATPAEIAAAKQNLEDAIAGLKADTTALEAALASVPADLTGYTTETAAAVNDAVAAADGLDENSAPADIAAAADAINNAVAGLKADLTDFNTALAAAQAKDTTGYTTATKTALEDAITAAGSITEDNTPAEVATATNNLEDALAGLKADTTDLEAALASVPADLTGYTTATATAVNDAVTAAAGLDEDSAPADIAAATDAINNAVAGLKADLTDFNTALAAAQAKDTTGYTTATKTALANAITAAGSITENNTPAEVATATNDLTNALAGLKADTSALDSALTAANAVVKTNYTAATVAALEAAVAAADGLDEDSAPADIAAAASAINDAIANLESALGDKTELDALINTVKDYALADYEDTSFAAFTTALTAAQTVSGNTTATQAEVDEAKNNLQAAVDDLVSIDTVLADKVAEANAIDTTGYTAASVSALNDAVTAASTATNKKQAISDIDTAIAGLIVDKSGLAASIAAAPADTTGMTAESVQALTDALADANTVNGKADATVAEVSAAKTALDNAIAGLTVDKTALAAKITNAKAIDTSVYTSGVAAFEAAITAAEAVYNDASATVADVNTAIINLNAAACALDDAFFVDHSWPTIDWRS